MLSDIFLLKGKDLNDVSHLDIYSYPFDIDAKHDDSFIKKVIEDHEKEIRGISQPKPKLSSPNKIEYELDPPIPQKIDTSNVFTMGIENQTIIGLIFENDDNPYDYKDIFEELCSEFLNNGESFLFNDESEIENFLITLFIDIRRYGDEILQRYYEIAFQSSEVFTKVFLFGIDDVGKSSLIRRLKTGQFSENFYTPTKKFNIEYLQEKDGQLAIWDMPGNLALRDSWLHGIQDSNILIYMIDIANQRSFKESKEEFWSIVDRDDVKGIPIIIVGNKVDLLNLDHQSREEQLTRTKNELMSYFEFNTLGGRSWEF
ncbi:MAG: ADP-ribosylation factor-like protein, partial [Candidatus Thorarchaeota archaeon]